MNNAHPSEKEIQEYAIDQSNSSAIMIQHIESCMVCRGEVKSYQLLFTEIKSQSEPAFDFDLSEMVLSQLPKKGFRLSVDNLIAAFLVIFSCFCVGIPVFLFRNNILNMFSGIPPFFVYTIITSTTIILLINILQMVRKYQHQIRLLNFN